jgi:protein-tyrosine phosphatase
MYAEHPAVQTMCSCMYDVILFEESSQEVFRQFFADLVTLDPAKGAVLWHCTQGKDRAGCASAMLLAALGADRDLIVADFTLSKSYYDPHTAQIPTTTEAQRMAINTLISANPAIFEASLDKVEARYGSLRGYLTECIGVTPEMMETLQERFLE